MARERERERERIQRALFVKQPFVYYSRRSPLSTHIHSHSPSFLHFSIFSTFPTHFLRLKTLQHAKTTSGVYTKTSLMLGLGETDEEVIECMRDLRAIDVDIITFGQYLRPTAHHLSVVTYVTPEKFEEFKVIGEAMGFKYVASGPLVRSSYKAGEFFLENLIRKERKGASFVSEENHQQLQ
jgi:hypothetical protein